MIVKICEIAQFTRATTTGSSLVLYLYKKSLYDPNYVKTVVGTVDSTSCTPFSDYATMATVPSQRMKACGLQMNAQRHVATVVMATVSTVPFIMSGH